MPSFRTASSPRVRRAAEWFARLPRPRLLYVDSLDNRIDVAQVAEVALPYPGASIVLVGPLHAEAHFAAVGKHPNVVIRAGHAPRPDVVGLIGASEACLIPDVGSRLTEAMSPLKLSEYLGGVPMDLSRGFRRQVRSPCRGPVLLTLVVRRS
jgi:hypothetical protein